TYTAQITVGGATASVSFTITATQLSAPGNLQWSGTTTTVTASWDEVTNAGSYTVQLYKDGTAEGNAVSVTTGTNMTFTITEAGSYTFTVTAVGTGNYSSSAASAASAALVCCTVTWKNDDITLKTDVVQSGATPSYSGNEPTKDTDSTYIYTFSGWSPEVDAITADTTYTAQYSKTYVAPTAGEGYTIDYSAETATATSGYEISTDGSTWSSTLTVTPGGTLYVRRAADTNASASAETTNTLADRPSAPSVTAVNEQWLNEDDGQITGVTTEMEYRLSGGTWADCSGTIVTGLAAGSYEVRYKATSSAFSGTAATVTIAGGTERTYTLTVTAPTFDEVTYGYTQLEAASITIESSGNSDATITSVTVSSANFTIAGSGSTVTAGGSNTDYTIRPVAGLAADTYTAIITVTYDGGATATDTVSFTVGKAVPSVTAPEAQILTYTGSAQELVSAGSTSGGTMYYSLDNSDWNTEVPTGTDAGTYTVCYKVIGDSNHNDYTPANNSVSVTIGKAEQSISYREGSVTKHINDAAFTNKLTEAAGDGGITYASDNTKVAVVNENTGEVTIVGAGTAAITATAVATENYNEARASYTLTVTGHSYEAVITEATYTEQGYTIYTCTHCGDSYKADYTAIKVIDGTDENLSTKTTVQGLTALPEGLKSLYSSVDELISDLISRVTVSTGYTADNTLVYDVVLQYSTDGGITWITATVDNFPAAGITVTLPYPSGTDSSYEFTVLHMFTETSTRLGITAGGTETPTVTKTDEGLVFTLTGLSPVAISWKAVNTAATETETSDAQTETTDTSGASAEDTVTGPSGTSTDNGVAETSEAAAQAETADSTTNPSTGDNSHAVLWFVLALLLALSIGVIGAATCNTRRKHGR
ncbi:MAG: hypothetical protein LUH58_04925, partial [Lachnospiraceae bacterium]|nr:hypothetical protein [Lachnospiraceae bacterium]